MILTALFWNARARADFPEKRSIGIGVGPSFLTIFPSAAPSLRPQNETIFRSGFAFDLNASFILSQSKPLYLAPGSNLFTSGSFAESGSADLVSFKFLYYPAETHSGIYAGVGLGFGEFFENAIVEGISDIGVNAKFKFKLPWEKTES